MKQHMQFVNGMTCAIGLTVVLISVHASRGNIGDTQCGSSFGPDIFIANIDAIANFVSVGSVDALSLGQTHCNIGNAELGFVHNTSNHPVIGANLFRLKDGRFEHIGMSWVMHGFFALSGNQCACGCTPTNGTALGIGCSDSNSALSEAQQFGLGPRSEVNPFTGAFPFPHGEGDNGPTGNSVYKRLQFKKTDVDPAQNGGGSFFVEMFVVAPGDAQAGNAENNASFRNVTLNQVNGEWQFILSGQTMRSYPAIYAWQLDDPHVLIRQVPVSGDGLFVAGANATYVGDGFWEYEYAIENLNVDRAARAVQIDIPPDVVVWNFGFHDVDYHSGEPYDGTDWAVLFNGVETYLSWYTNAYDVNPNANALRWSTTYNFRFRANRAPVPGSVTIELFKPGTPTSVSAELIVPNPVRPDCNLNNIDDACDLSCLTDGSLCNVTGCGQSGDVNFNGLPDECEILGDSNNDGDVDLHDFAVLADCLSGPGLPAPSDDCLVFDVAADDDVDLHDFAPVMNSFAP